MLEPAPVIVNDPVGLFDAFTFFKLIVDTVTEPVSVMFNVLFSELKDDSTTVPVIELASVPVIVNVRFVPVTFFRLTVPTLNVPSPERVSVPAPVVLSDVKYTFPAIVLAPAPVSVRLPDWLELTLFKLTVPAVTDPVPVIFNVLLVEVKESR